MSLPDVPSVLELLRHDPVGGGLLVVLPAVVAAAQLLNSHVNDLPFLVSVPFAVVMVAFSGVVVSHRLARLRMRHLEKGATGPASD